MTAGSVPKMLFQLKKQKSCMYTYISAVNVYRSELSIVPLILELEKK